MRRGRVSPVAACSATKSILPEVRPTGCWVSRRSPTPTEIRAALCGCWRKRANCNPRYRMRGTALGTLQRNTEALAALDLSAASFKQANSLEELGTTFGELATVEAQMGDWQTAYKYRSEAQTTSEKLLHNQLDQRFATLKVEFDTATKEKENLLLFRQTAATEAELVQERRASTLQTAVILLSLLDR